MSSPAGSRAAEPRGAETLLDVSALSVAYGRGRAAQTAVADVSLQVRRGSILGLAGESGCGKSTTALASTGYWIPGMGSRSGRVLLDGVDLLTQTVRELRQLWGRRIAFVQQDAAAALAPTRRVGALFGDVASAHCGLEGAAARAATEEVLKAVGLPIGERALRRYPFEFSGGQQQRLALALALLPRPAVVIMDEPTTGLDVTTQAAVIQLIRDIVGEFDIGVLFVSHDLALLREHCSEVAIMYGGQIVECAPTAQLWADPRHPYTAALLAAAPTIDRASRLEAIPGRPPRSVVADSCAFAPRCTYAIPRCVAGAIPLREDDAHAVRCVRWPELGPLTSRLLAADARPPKPQPAALLEFGDVTCRFRSGGAAPVVHGVSAAVGDAEILAIVGESGSGKSTLLRALVGIHRLVDGDLRYRGQAVPWSVSERPLAVRQAIQIVFQNPRSSLNPRHTIGRALRRPLDVFEAATSHAEERDRIVEMLDAVQLDATLERRYPGELSGGQLQRVAIARALVARPSVVLCDEIVSALDVSVQAAILNLVADLRDRLSIAFVFVSHDLAVVRSIADRIVVMSDGAVAESGPTDEIFEAPVHPYTRALLAAGRARVAPSRQQ